MPLGEIPVCSKCEITESLLWKNVNREIVCFNCSRDKFEIDELDDPPAPIVEIKVQKPKPKAPKQKNGKSGNQKGRGRKVAKAKVQLKAPDPVLTVVKDKSVLCDGYSYKSGDIVSLIDENDENIYYAQIKELLTDQYCEKSAIITWLLPTKKSPPSAEGFDATTYIIGPEEDEPRSLRSMEFVMHAPSSYYKLDTHI